MKNTLWVLLYALIAGAGLALFAQIEGFIRYTFTLATFFSAMHFFRKYESRAMRVSFIILSAVFYLAIGIAITIYNFVQEYPEVLQPAA